MYLFAPLTKLKHTLHPTTAAKTVNQQLADRRTNNEQVWKCERSSFRDDTVGCGHN